MLSKKNIFLLLLVFNILLQATVRAAIPISNLVVVPGSERHSAPELTLDNLRGDTFSLADYRGKLVLLNFWATWCMPCREEMPGMETLWQNYKDQGLVIVAVSVDEGSQARVEKFSKKFGLSFPVLLDPESRVSDLYKVSSMPTSFLIDRDGGIIGRIVGTEDWSSDEALKFMGQLLAQ